MSSNPNVIEPNVILSLSKDGHVKLARFRGELLIRHQAA